MNQNLINKSLAISLLLFTLIWCGAQDMEAQTRSSVNGFEVTVHIFSGRKNPGFTISDPTRLLQLESIYSNSTDAPRFSKESVSPVRLGYTGIVIRRKGSPGKLTAVGTIAVYGGFISMTPHKKGEHVTPTFKVDSGARLENFLLDEALATGAINQKLFDIIKKKQTAASNGKQ